MISVSETLSNVTDILRSVTQFGVALIFTAVIIDILFPGSTGLVANLSEIVKQFSEKGLAGLIALLLFLVLFKPRASD